MKSLYDIMLKVISNSKSLEVELTSLAIIEGYSFHDIQQFINNFITIVENSHIERVMEDKTIFDQKDQEIKELIEEDSSRSYTIPSQLPGAP